MEQGRRRSPEEPIYIAAIEPAVKAGLACGQYLLAFPDTPKYGFACESLQWLCCSGPSRCRSMAVSRANHPGLETLDTC